MKKSLLLIASGLLLTILSTQSANAIFGWECRKPKQTLEALSKEIQIESAKAEKLIRKEASAWYSSLKSEVSYCKKLRAFEKSNNIKSPTAGSMSSYNNYWKKMEKGGFKMFSDFGCDRTAIALNMTPSFEAYIRSVFADYSSSRLERERSSKIDEFFAPARALLKTSRRVIVNNQKCFTPLEVAEAQEALKS